MRRRIAGAALVVATALPGAAQAPGLEATWPHGAGSAWTYDRVSLEWGPVRKAAFDAVRFELGETATIGAGTRVQPLAVATPSAASRTPEFWRQLALARPGRAWATARGATSGMVIHDATLLRVADDEIAGYRDVPVMRSWLYLEPDRRAGHRFHLQLVPDFADSVFLDGEVLGAVDISTPAGSFAAALRVRYTIDYGWADVRDSIGGLLGRMRATTRGEMFYVTGVGPVLARETFVPQSATQGDPPPLPLDSTFVELRLQSYALTPAAIEAATWGAIKQRYR